MTYFNILLVYAAVDVIACVGLSLQLGVAGVSNLGFIVFQAAGAYVAAALALPSDTANGGFQRYIGGLSLPFPLPWLGAMAAGALLALPFTFLVGRRLRGDFAAIGLLVTAVLLNLLVMNYVPLFNGAAGLANVPAPLQPVSVVLVSTSSGYQYGFAFGALALAAAAFWYVRRITESPYGRSLRAMRDNDRVAESLGKNLLALRTGVLVSGGALAALSGAILVSYIDAWDPSAWTYGETIVLLTAVIIGGSGNNVGAVLGALLVPVGFLEATRFITNNNPNLPPNLMPSLQWVAIGLLITTFLWLRPRGVLPERKRVIPRPPSLLSRALPGRAWTLEAPVTPPRLPPAAGQQEEGRAEALQAVGLSKDYDGVHAVAGVSLSVRRGTLTGLIGPNGAGKSTLLALLAGSVRSSAGQVIYQGRDITALAAFRRSRIGLVRTFQLASEFKRLTVMENLLSSVPSHRGDSFLGALAGRWYWRADEAAAIGRAQALLARFGLAEHANSYAGDLSGGQRRLVEIMRALMAEPQMLLLDEPMAGVHPELARTIGNALRALCEEGMTILMVEHELAIMDEFCDPVIVMADGAVLAEGTMTELRDRAEVVEAYLVG
jgi:branched-chain amino acid transport system permease protein